MLSHLGGEGEIGPGAKSEYIREMFTSGVRYLLKSAYREIRT